MRDVRKAPWLRTLLLLLALAPFAAAKQAAQVPAWSADLKPYSYADRPPRHYYTGPFFAGGEGYDSGVLFASANEVICYFATKSGRGFSRRDQLTASSPFQLQVLSFDAKTGALRYHKTLPSRAGQSWMGINAEGNFLVRTGDFVRLYSPDLTLLKEHRLAERSAAEQWWVRLSTSGRTLLLVHQTPDETTDEVVSSATFEPIAVLKGQHYPVISIADHGLLKADPWNNRIFLRDFSGKGKTMVAPEEAKCTYFPTLLNDHTLLVTCDPEVLLIKPDGSAMMRDRFENYEWLETAPAATRNGTFIGVSAVRYKEHAWSTVRDGRSAERRGTRVVVYNAVERKHVAVVRIEPQPKNDYNFAIAPDGSALGVMVDGRLQLYPLK